MVIDQASTAAVAVKHLSKRNVVTTTAGGGGAQLRVLAGMLTAADTPNGDLARAVDGARRRPIGDAGGYGWDRREGAGGEAACRGVASPLGCYRPSEEAEEAADGRHIALNLVGLMFFSHSPRAMESSTASANVWPASSLGRSRAWNCLDLRAFGDYSHRNCGDGLRPRGWISPMAAGLGFKFGVAALALGLHLTGAGVAAAAPSNGAYSDGGSRVVASKIASSPKLGSLADLAAELGKKKAANREALLKYLEGLKKPKPVKAGKPVLTTTQKTEKDGTFESMMDAQNRLSDMYQELLRP